MRDDASAPKDITSLSMFNSKVVSLNDEYTIMLASTLESQRVYYQQTLQKMQEDAGTTIEEQKAQINKLEYGLQETDKQIEE